MAGLDIPVPQAIARTFDGEFPAFFTFTKRFLAVESLEFACCAGSDQFQNGLCQRVVLQRGATNNSNQSYRPPGMTP